MGAVDVRARRHALYRFYDAAETLLYVGITCNPSARFDKHSTEKEWWHDVARIDIETMPDRDSVLAAERAAIQSEGPLHNIRMNRDIQRESDSDSQQPGRESVGLVGRFFHTWRELGPDEDVTYSTVMNGRALVWQGHVVEQIDPNVYLVELFSWWDGCPNGTQIATLDEMRSWTFHPSAIEMMAALPCGESWRDWTCRNPVTHYNDNRKWGGGISFVCGSCVGRFPGFRDYPEIKWRDGKIVKPT